MSDDRKTVILNKLNAIPNQIDVPAPLGRRNTPQPMHDNLAKIHGLITRWELKEATSIIELAICNVEICDRDIGSRVQVRMQCGREMQGIMSGVLQFFDYNTDEE